MSFPHTPDPRNSDPRDPDPRVERKSGLFPRRLRAGSVALLYALIAGLWIWLSDTVLARLLIDPAQLATWQTYKGWFFVAVSALLLWVERTWSDRRVAEAESRLRERMMARTSELERVRAQLQIILDNAPVSFSMRSVDNRYLLTNRRWEEYMGVSSADALDKRPGELFPPDVAEQLTAALEAVLATQDGLIEEIPMHLHGRDYFFMRASFPLFDQTGKPYAAIGLVTDITERRAIQDSLRQAEERFRAIFQTVGVGINLVSPSGHYVGANPAFQQMLGYAESEILGKHYRDLAYLPDLEDDEEVTRRIHERPHETALVERRFVCADGSLIWTHMHISVISNRNGSLALYLAVVEEITARKEAEAEQQRAQEELARLVTERTAELQRTHDQLRAINGRLSAILQASPLGIVVTDAERMVQLWNPAAEQIYGYRAEEVLGKPVPDFQAPGDSGYFETRERIFSGEHVNALEAKRKRSDGVVIDVSISTAPLHDSSGALTGTVAIVRDITERKQAEAEVLRLNRELEERVVERTAHLEKEIAERVRAEAEINELNGALAEQAQDLFAINKELETFTYSVSHDLKAPLRGIDGYSRLLLEDYADRLDEEGHYFLRTIRSATTQMAQLIDDLLSYSRLERRTILVNPTDIRELVENVLHQMQPAQLYPQTEIEVNVESTQVSADPEALALALRNLVDNALKFSANAPHPKIIIAGERHENYYRLSVCDNGVGFDMQYQERIFEIFQRLHRSEDYPGTGIGLAMVRKALLRMQGRVWAESQPGQGATFTMEIPAL